MPYYRYRDLMLAWDNTPRHGNRAVIYHDVTPELYEGWMRDCYLDARRKFVGEKRLDFVNAWNVDPVPLFETRFEVRTGISGSNGEGRPK
jgi:hypothetical protein